MALFSKSATKAAISPAPSKAAAAGGYTSNQAGVSMIGQYYSYQEGEARNRAISVPAINRARDLMASVIGCMPLRMYNERWFDGKREKIYLDPRSWLRRPDPTVPYQFLMAWTLDDLLMFGRAFWHVSSRYADGRPASFQRLPAGSITTTDMVGPVWFAPSKEVYFNGGMLNPDDLVQFLSPAQGLIYSAPGAIETALKIEAARNRNASSQVPAGVLRQVGGEPLSAQELADLAAAFNQARLTNQTAALNEFVTYTETNMTPDKMLLIDSANYSALEAARLANVPPYLVGVSTGSYSYQSSQQARADLYIFGVKLYAEAIAETLSMDNVLPAGTFVEFDPSEYLAENYEADRADEPVTENTQEQIARR